VDAFVWPNESGDHVQLKQNDLEQNDLEHLTDETWWKLKPSQLWNSLVGSQS